MSRPRIGIAGPDQGGWVAWLFASWAVRRAGGHPVRLTPARGLPTKPLDGLILGGGADVETARYAPHEEAPDVREELEAQHGARSKLRVLASYLLAPFIFLLRRLFSTRLSGIDKARDALEIALIAQTVGQGAPILGICRGAQLLNVCFGGTLHRDLTSFYVERGNPWTPFPRKPVEIVEGSRLQGVLKSSRCAVNSLHRHAVDRLGQGIQIAAQEPNGVIQAIEQPEYPFLIGVQWHPEYLPQRPEQRRLFRTLVRFARSHSAGAGSRAAATLRPREELLVQLAMTQEDRQRIDQAKNR